MADLARNDEAYERFSAAVDVPITVLGLIWVIILILPGMAHLSSGVTDALNLADYVIWAVFVVEYVIKFYLAPSRVRFVTHHLIDLAAIALPVLRPVRALRILRVLRVLSVMGTSVRRARGAFTHRGLHVVLSITLILVVGGAALEYGFEHAAPGANITTFSDALWWAIVTVTTVGYGDRFPVTPEGRGVAVVLMLVGISLIGVLTANVASYFIQSDAKSAAHQLEERVRALEEGRAVDASGPLSGLLERYDNGEFEEGDLVAALRELTGSESPDPV